jgi:hypothetical protein
MTAAKLLRHRLQNQRLSATNFGDPAAFLELRADAS